MEMFGGRLGCAVAAVAGWEQCERAVTYARRGRREKLMVLTCDACAILYMEVVSDNLECDATQANESFWLATHGENCIHEEEEAVMPSAPPSRVQGSLNELNNQDD